MLSVLAFVYLGTYILVVSLGKVLLYSVHIWARRHFLIHLFWAQNNSRAEEEKNGGHIFGQQMYCV